MDKIFAIQRTKLNTTYGGVGTIIDTIDNFSYKIDNFDNWPIYQSLEDSKTRNDSQLDLTKLIHKEPRLLKRLKSVGFNKIDEFFLAETSYGEIIKPYSPSENQIKKMLSASYFPRYFYCPSPRCRKLKLIDTWKNEWDLDQEWSKRPPKCNECSTRKRYRVYGKNLRQVRFVLASMETGKIKDIPWDKICYKKNNPGNGDKPNVWDFSNPKEKIDSKQVTYHERNGGSNLTDIYIKAEDGTIVTMAVIMKKYFIMLGDDGTKEVYRPIVYSANNIYFPYVINSVYIPELQMDEKTVNKIRRKYDRGKSIDAIMEDLIEDEITQFSRDYVQALINNNFTIPEKNYETEEAFRLDEFDFLTNQSNYNDQGVYRDTESRLVIEKYNWQGKKKIGFIKQLYLIKRLNVTSVLVAYSRFDKISINSLSRGKGHCDNPKRWYDIKKGEENNSVEVALCPTCTDKAKVRRIPVVSSFGEGFFVELDLDFIRREDNKKPIEEDKKSFLHTFAHLIMKTLEFTCGYPLPSMSERLYILPTSITKEDVDRYGFMIYCVNGEAGSYGGIVSLFENNKIEQIFERALFLAEDCPNDPICGVEGGSCFACVQVPETSCELFNQWLSRKKFNHYRNRQNIDNSDINNGVSNDVGPSIITQTINNDNILA